MAISIYSTDIIYETPHIFIGARNGKGALRNVTSASGANVIKLFTVVIYYHSMVILSFCIIKLYYPENHSGMAVNYHGILTLQKVGLKVPR